jgi:hypothetical protein
MLTQLELNDEPAFAVPTARKSVGSFRPATRKKNIAISAPACRIHHCALTSAEPRQLMAQTREFVPVNYAI